MKKTISLMLAVLIAAVAICTLAMSAFAAPGDDDDPVNDPGMTVSTTETTTATTTATTTTETTTKADETTSTTKADETTATTATTTTPDVTKTMAASQTNYVDPDENSTKSTTKAPAKVDNAIPSTGSSVVVPAIALLALAAGTVAVVKTKKDN